MLSIYFIHFVYSVCSIMQAFKGRVSTSYSYLTTRRGVNQTLSTIAQSNHDTDALIYSFVTADNYRTKTQKTNII